MGRNDEARVSKAKRKLNMSEGGTDPPNKRQNNTAIQITEYSTRQRSNATANPVEGEERKAKKRTKSGKAGSAGNSTSKKRVTSRFLEEINSENNNNAMTAKGIRVKPVHVTDLDKVASQMQRSNVQL